MSEYKIYIYDSQGSVVEERNPTTYIIVKQEVTEHNQANPEDLRYMVRATQFPPLGFVWDSGDKSLRALTLTEKVANGQETIPPGHKIVGNVFVKKTVSEQVADGEITLKNDEKVSADGGRVEKKTLEENLNDGTISDSDYIDECRLKLKTELDRVLKLRLEEFSLIENYAEYTLIKNLVFEWKSKTNEGKLAIVVSDSELIRFGDMFKKTGAAFVVPQESVDSVDAFVTLFLTETALFEEKIAQVTVLRDTIYHNLETIASESTSALKIQKANSELLAIQQFS